MKKFGRRAFDLDRRTLWQRRGASALVVFASRDDVPSVVLPRLRPRVERRLCALCVAPSGGAPPIVRSDGGSPSVTRVIKQHAPLWVHAPRAPHSANVANKKST